MLYTLCIIYIHTHTCTQFFKKPKKYLGVPAVAQQVKDLPQPL